jgi:hypothetical protein
VQAHVMAVDDAGGAAALLKIVDAAEPTATAAIDKLLWVPANHSRGSLGHYRAMQSTKGSAPDALMSDSLHANLWSMLLGFGPIVAATNSSNTSEAAAGSQLSSHLLEEHKRNCVLPGVTKPVGCLGIAHFPKIGRHGSQDLSPSFSMDLTANLIFSRAWNASAFLRGDLVTPAEIVTKMQMFSQHADFFNWRDMYHHHNVITTIRSLD